MYLVTGATGKTGSAVANRLLDEGRPTRVFLRSAKKGQALAERGAEIAIGTLEDVGALTAAMEGATGAYLMLPYDHNSENFIEDGRVLAEGYAKAAAEAGVTRVVGLSSIGAHTVEPIGPMGREKHFEDAFGDHPGARFLRAAYFVENWAPALAAAQDGSLPTFLPAEVPLQMVSSADIGNRAAALLLADEAPRITELAGPKDLSPKQVATVVGTILGKSVVPLEAPLDQVAAAFRQFGFSGGIADLVQEMYVAYAEGRVTFEAREPARGVIPIEDTLRGLLDL